MLIVNTKLINDATIIEITGDVDLYSSPMVRKTILKFISKKSPFILVNLAGVSYMDSSGVATLVEGLQMINEYKGMFGIFNVQGAVKDVFELSRLDKVFNIYNNETEALTAYNVKS